MSEATPAEAAIEQFAVEQTAGWTPVMERQCRAAGGRSTYVSGIAHGLELVERRDPKALQVVGLAVTDEMVERAARALFVHEMGADTVHGQTWQERYAAEAADYREQARVVLSAVLSKVGA